VDFELPQVWFGAVGGAPVDWRLHQEPGDPDDDDAGLPRTPPDVVRMLGFDPRRIDDA
jgi:hypothetical protein